MRITVLGGGGSAQTMAADLSLRGHRITLFDFPEYQANIEAPLRTGTIEKYGSIDSKGVTGLARLDKVTTDVGDAVRGAEALFLAVPAYAHAIFFDAIAAHLEEGQIVCVFPGNWGALRLRNLLRKRKGAPRVYVADTDLCMHICRVAEPFLGPGKVRVILERGRVRVAAAPASDGEHVLNKLKEVYPELVGGSNVMETALFNSNIIGHGPLVLMNAGWLEHTGGKFMIYRDGVTPSVGRVTDEIGRERDRVAEAFGLKVGGGSGRTTFESLKAARWVNDPCEIGPPDMHNRYITEDIPYGLVPLAGLAGVAGVPTPVTDAMINIANVVNGVDYWSEGLTLAALEIDHGSVAEIVAAVKG